MSAGRRPPGTGSARSSRERGIPTVMGTGIATRRIRNEQQIAVDGDPVTGAA